MLYDMVREWYMWSESRSSALQQHLVACPGWPGAATGAAADLRGQDLDKTEASNRRFNNAHATVLYEYGRAGWARGRHGWANPLAWLG